MTYTQTHRLCGVSRTPARQGGCPGRPTPDRAGGCVCRTSDPEKYRMNAWRKHCHRKHRQKILVFVKNLHCAVCGGAAPNVYTSDIEKYRMNAWGKHCHRKHRKKILAFAKNLHCAVCGGAAPNVCICEHPLLSPNKHRYTLKQTSSNTSAHNTYSINTHHHNYFNSISNLNFKQIQF